MFVTASDETTVRPAKRLKVAAASPEHVATRDVLKVAAFIIGPVALALVLIAGAFLLARSFKASRELAAAKTQTVPTQAATPAAPPRPKPETISPAVPPLPTTPKESPPPELPVTPPGHREKEEEELPRPPKPKDPDPDDGFPKPPEKSAPKVPEPGLDPAGALALARAAPGYLRDDAKVKASYDRAAAAFKQGVAVEAQLAQVNAALLDPNLRFNQVRTRELTRQQQKLEEALRQLTTKYDAEADGFMKDRAALLEALNGEGSQALREIRRTGGPADKTALDTVLSGLQLFVLSEHEQLPRFATNSTFLDQEFWREIGTCVAASGDRHAPEILRMFKSRNVVAQYAAAVAVAQIGPTTAENDRNLQVELQNLTNRLATTRVSRKERDARAKVIADAQAAIKARN